MTFHDRRSQVRGWALAFWLAVVSLAVAGAQIAAFLKWVWQSLAGP